MAMQVNYTNPAGIDVTYWKIIELNINYIQKFARIRLAGYKDINTRQDNMEFVESKYYNITPLKFDEYFSVNALDNENVNPVKQSYFYIKQNDELFNNAIDV